MEAFFNLTTQEAQRVIPSTDQIDLDHMGSMQCNVYGVRTVVGCPRFEAPPRPLNGCDLIDLFATVFERKDGKLYTLHASNWRLH